MLCVAERLRCRRAAQGVPGGCGPRGAAGGESCGTLRGAGAVGSVVVGAVGLRRGCWRGYGTVGTGAPWVVVCVGTVVSSVNVGGKILKIW